jgi:malto-oligosyltrehalose trehalohydrolase
MERAHAMPCGAQLEADGRVRFRLWAPAARRVELCLEEPDAVLPLEAHADGWHELLTTAAPGRRYRYRIDDGPQVPDPASRFQPQGVHGPSEVVDPRAFPWQDAGWRGRPWQETVVYELHVGSFTPQGGYAGVMERLDHLATLGVTALELMPLAAFPGHHGWGYDGVLPYAPHAAYGRPEELKALVQAAHRRGLMVLLDVVYNHFGPEGNYLHLYAPAFFSSRHHTPWGAALNFDGEDSGPVRDFFIHNALYWLEEYHLDGLRLDAVHAIADDSQPDILEELAARVQARFGGERTVHLVLENDHNAARYLERDYRAQWNDDLHHALHVLLSGETVGYYADYADAPARHLGRCLAEGFAYQGEPSPFRDGQPRGEPSGHLPPDAFVGFLQNHDQVGNRARGERITRLAEPAAVQAAMTVLLVAPAIPLLFMGEEWGCRQPFSYFCDFGPELAAQVAAGRRREFAALHDLGAAPLPDPGAADTFTRARLDWTAAATPAGRLWQARVQELLSLRRHWLVPRLAGAGGGRYRLLAPRAVQVDWRLGGSSALHLLANLGPEPVAGVAPPPGRLLHACDDAAPAALAGGALPPWSVLWLGEAA